MAAEAHQHAGMALADEVERVAQVKARRSSGPSPSAARRCAAREDEGRPVQAVLQADGDDADHALVELGVEERQRRRRLAFAASACSSSASACSRMPASTSRRSRLMRVELLRQLGGARRVVGEQAFDAERHVGQAAGGVDARAEREAEVERRWRARRRGRRRRTAPRRPAACGRRGCASGPARRGGGCWRRAGRRRRRCRAPPGRAARRAAAASAASNAPRARSSARSASST